jgi:phosphatidylserine/phosphatidylglycerophosphate/cardiolipin synthase-like enzyme
VLRFALMETEGVAANLAAQRKIIKRLRARPNVVVAIGNRIQTNAFDRWLEELDQVHSSLVHIHWIHTKYALLDPLGATPIVITGSANFSKASTDSNDENMLVIRGDKRVADIYLVEFMRLYAHYAFRESVKRYLERVANGHADDWRPQYLEPTDAWQKSYFDPRDRSARYARRRYFSGAPAARVAPAAPV